MISDRLPEFAYHPDSLITGSIVPSTNHCVVCRRERGYVYNGLPFADQEFELCICPWCIGDGSAADRLGATFNDLDAGDDWSSVSEAVVDEILYRTPGFTGWQQERWMAHCDDAMVFLGPMGHPELLELGEHAVRAVSEEFRVEGWSHREIDRYVRSLERDGEPTAYVFRCRHCGLIRGYSDFT